MTSVFARMCYFVFVASMSLSNIRVLLSSVFLNHHLTIASVNGEADQLRGEFGMCEMAQRPKNKQAENQEESKLEMIVEAISG